MSETLDTIMEDGAEKLLFTESRVSRRQVLKGLVGMGAGVGAGAVGLMLPSLASAATTAQPLVGKIDDTGTFTQNNPKSLIWNYSDPEYGINIEMRGTPDQSLGNAFQLLLFGAIAYLKVGAPEHYKALKDTSKIKGFHLAEGNAGFLNGEVQFYQNLIPPGKFMGYDLATSIMWAATLVHEGIAHRDEPKNAKKEPTLPYFVAEQRALLYSWDTIAKLSKSDHGTVQNMVSRCMETLNEKDWKLNPDYVRYATRDQFSSSSPIGNKYALDHAKRFTLRQMQETVTGLKGMQRFPGVDKFTDDIFNPHISAKSNLEKLMPYLRQFDSNYNWKSL